MSLTYRELRDRLDNLTESQLDDAVTVHIDSADEFYPVMNFQTNDAEQEDDRLHDGHMFFAIGTTPDDN